MGLNIQDLLTRFDRSHKSISINDLMDGLETLDVSLTEVADFVHFGRDSYQRNLLRAGQAYQALVLCWRSGQRSPVHDHSGSACGVRVLQGIATETVFERSAQGLVYPSSSAELPPGHVMASLDTDIHQVSNLQAPDTDLITLHIYSPPLLVMNTFSLTDATVVEFHDPIFSFAEGAGI